MYHKAIRHILFILVCTFHFQVFAQNLTQSPYSVVGVGDMMFQGTAQQSAMGQVAQGIRRTNEINNLNPASYSGFELTLFEAAYQASSGIISNANSNADVNNMSFAYFMLGVPISQKKGIGWSFGLQPYSGMGYNLKLNTPFNGLPYKTEMMGRGGLTRVYTGLGFKLYKGLSIGTNVAYLFGQTRQNQILILDKSYTQFSLASERNTSINDFQFQTGIQYVHEWKDKYTFIFGSTFTIPSSLNANQDYAFRTVLDDGSTTIDTISNRLNEEGSIDLPLMLSGGISFQRNDKWTIAADFHQANWSEFRFMGQSDSLKNSTGVSLGFSIIPDYANFKNILNRIEYRVGIRYDNGNLQFNDNAITTTGISAGIGIPMGKSRSRINLTAEYFLRGTTNNNLLREEYFRFTLGVNMVDRWFQRYKYD
jgi:long-subunit fatty acid transport protein